MKQDWHVWNLISAFELIIDYPAEKTYRLEHGKLPLE